MVFDAITSPAYLGLAVGALIPLAVISAIFWAIYRAVSPWWARSLLSALSSFVVSGILAGIGSGSGGFDSRFINALTGAGFVGQIPALVLLLAALALIILLRKVLHK